MTTRLTPLQLMEKLVSFPTVSRDSNLPLVDWVEDYLNSHGITAHRHPNTCAAASQVLFELGVAALEGERTLVGVAASGHLTHLVERNAPATGELVVDTIGLLSHFWTDSEAARDFARERLLGLRGHLKDELAVALESTREAWALRTWFATADRVRTVARELVAEVGAGAS